MESWSLEILGTQRFIAPSGIELSKRFLSSHLFIRMIALGGADGVPTKAIENLLCEDEWKQSNQGIRNFLSRLVQRAKQLSETPCVERVGDRIRLIPSHVHCDLWIMRQSIARLRTSYDPESEHQCLSLLANIDDRLFEETFPPEKFGHFSADLAQEILSWLVLLSRLPSATPSRFVLLRALNGIRDQLRLDSLTIESLIHIFGALGLKQELIEAYVDYEHLLDSEIGDTPARKISNLVDQFVAQLEDSSQCRFLDLPSAPSHHFGQEAEYQDLVTLVKDGQTIYLGGISGSGKTHLLRKLVNDSKLQIFRKAWIDLMQSCESDILSGLPSSLPDLVVFDNYSSSHASLVDFILRRVRPSAAIISGPTPLGIGPHRAVTLKPLPIDGDAAGPAFELLAYSSGFTLDELDNDEVRSILGTSGGLPLDLVFVGKMVRTLGIASARLHCENGGLLNRTASQPSLSAFAIEKTIDQYSHQVKDVFALLSGVGFAVPMRAITAIYGVPIAQVLSMVDAGLVMVDPDRSKLEVPRQVRQLLVNHSIYGEHNPNVERFLTEFSDLFESMTLNGLPPIELSEQVVCASKVAAKLVNRGKTRSALRVLSKLRPHSGHVKDVVVSISELESCLWNESLPAEEFINGALAIGAQYLYKFDYEGMHNFVVSVLKDPYCAEVNPDLVLELHSQLGLSLRGTGDLEQSLAVFDAALMMVTGATSRNLIPKLYYNQSLTLVAMRRYEEALESIRDAMKFAEYLPNDDSRVELLQMEATRMRECGIDESEVGQRYQIALGYARNYKLAAHEGWILQNMAKWLTRSLTPVQTIVLAAYGMHCHVRSGFTSDCRRNCRGSLELLANSLAEFGYTSLAAQAKLIGDRLDEHPLNNGTVDNYRRQVSELTKLPFSLNDRPVHPKEILDIAAKCLSTFATHEESSVIERKYSLDLQKWSTQSRESGAVESPPHQSLAQSVI